MKRRVKGSPLKPTYPAGQEKKVQQHGQLKTGPIPLLRVVDSHARVDAGPGTVGDSRRGWSACFMGDRS